MPTELNPRSASEVGTPSTARERSVSALIWPSMTTCEISQAKKFHERQPSGGNRAAPSSAARAVPSLSNDLDQLATVGLILFEDLRYQRAKNR